MHKVFISYHHEDQEYKDELVRFGKTHSIFLDRSVDTGDIPDDWSDEQIRHVIRDEYLRDSTVTIVLVGRETKHRKHVDWEIYSSMYDGSVNKKSGIVAINLPGVFDDVSEPHGHEEKKQLYPDIECWKSVEERGEYERLFPCMPERIIDNLVNPDARVSVAPWCRTTDKKTLKLLIDLAFRDRSTCDYDLHRLMKRTNS